MSNVPFQDSGYNGLLQGLEGAGSFNESKTQMNEIHNILVFFIYILSIVAFHPAKRVALSSRQSGQMNLAKSFRSDRWDWGCPQMGLMWDKKIHL